MKKPARLREGWEGIEHRAEFRRRNKIKKNITKIPPASFCPLTTNH